MTGRRMKSESSGAPGIGLFSALIATMAQAEIKTAAPERGRRGLRFDGRRSLKRNARGKYPVEVARERGWAWAGDGVKPAETRQMRRARERGQA